MHVLHVGAEVRDRLLRALPAFGCRRLHVPKRREPVVGEAVEKVPKARCIRERSGRLHKDRHRPLSQGLDDLFYGKCALIGIGLVCMDRDIRNSEVDGRGKDAFHFLEKCAVGKVRHRPRARNRKPPRDQFAARHR